MNPVPLLSYKKVFIVKYLKNHFRPQCIKPDINIFGGKIFNFLLGMFYNVDGSEQEKNKWNFPIKTKNRFKKIYKSESEFNEFKPSLKSHKNRF